MTRLRLLVLIAVLGLLSCNGEGSYQLQPPQLQGGPLRVADASGDRVYLLTSQWIKRSSVGFRTRSRDISWMHLDLWAFDAATAQPVYRSRLSRRRIHGDAATLGVDNGVLWARLPELVGVRLADGVIVAESARIGARNPALASLLPAPTPPGMYQTEAGQPFKFDEANGLVLMLADARRVRIDANSLLASPIAAPATSAAASSVDPVPARERTRVRPLRASSNPVLRGVAMGKDWLGLVAETELADLRESRQINPVPDWSVPQRYRLYRAEVKRSQEFFGPVDSLVNPTLLADSPEFVMAGLLSGDHPKQVLWKREPDSVFVLSRDRIDRLGHVQVARVAGPAGRIVWSRPTPLTAIDYWLPSAEHALMIGSDLAATRSAWAQPDEEAAMQLVGLDLDSGELQRFDFDRDRDWPATDQPASQREPVR